MEITNISSLDRTSFLNQDYKPQDETLLNALEVNSEFGNPEDKIEIHIISPNGDVIESVYDFKNYKITNTTQNSSLYNQIELDPKSDLESFGYFSGQYDVNYNFYRQLFLSSPANNFYISEISSDRTEIKITNNNISYTELGQNYLNYVATRNSRNFYSDFILNFGENDTYIAVNVALDNVNTTTPSLYIKLYEPLPSNISIKNTLWLVESISEPYSFRVNTEFIAEDTNATIPLKGPNINIELNDRVNLTTPYLNLSNLLTNSSTSSYQQLQSWLEEKSIEITVDYTNFSNFVHFSSAVERLDNFKYKLSQIQSLQADLTTLNNLSTGSSFVNTNKEILQNKLNAIIEKFDGYEYYLYFESGSKAWPKINSSKPYINAGVNDLQSKTWFGSNIESSNYYGGEILSASNYDTSNRDYIWNNLPDYIKSDSQNSNLEIFTSMLGQHYDYIWTYIKDITDIQVADNRLDFGISKDLVADTLRNFGIKLYTNSRNQDDIYSSLLGMNNEGSFLPSTGSYLIDTYVTASQYTIPDNDIVKETYKRLYHNLPYLLKTRGTRTGLRALINCFGIPETILRVNEYGGLNKNSDEVNNIYEKFNYSLSNTDLIIPFQPSYQQFLNTGFNNIYPDTLEFRFKLDSNNILPTQSLLESDNNWKTIKIIYTTGSNANINFGLNNDNTYIYSPSIELPLYNEGWWNLNLTRETGSLRASNTGSNQTYTLTIGNKDDNGTNYLQSCSIFITGSTQSLYNLYGWNTPDQIFPGSQQNVQYPFSGSIQEFRYWIGSIPIENFKDHILNPLSISYLNNTGSYNNLIFRLPLGSELDNISSSVLTSVHPSNISTFYSSSITSSTADLNGDITYDINTEQYLINSPNIGALTEINDKIRIIEPNLISGSVLTPYISIQKPGDIRPTNDLNIVEVSLSPQDSINEDIIAQLGNFNIDEYIGDPRNSNLDSYPELTQLRNFYFQKYSSSQNIFDIIKLLSYFDNSLFKMIKDFVPAKSNLSTGLTIKPHILERNKNARYEPVLSFVEYSGSIETAFISGSNGLDQNLNTDYIEVIDTPLSGTFNFNHTDRRELFTGELNGTETAFYYPQSRSIVYEKNKLPISTSLDIATNYSELPFIPTLNNIMDARVSNRYLDVDYSYNPITPVNINYLSASLFLNLRTNSYSFLKAHVQDSNYTLKRHTQPRYEGSRLYSQKYNTYSPNDISFGSDPVINHNSVKFAYFDQITSQSLTLNGRCNANIKYLIDSASNIIELTEANQNLFDVQDIFNKTNVNIALDNTKVPSNQKSLNGLKSIYAGGFRYEPILQNYSLDGTTQTSLNFTLENEIATINPASGSLVTSSTPGFIEIVGSPSLITPITLSPSLNTAGSTISAVLNSGIKFDVVRKFASNNTIYQRITGTIDVTVSISPPGNQTMQLWRDNGQGPFTFNIPFPRQGVDNLVQSNGAVINMWEDIRYMTLPFGYISVSDYGRGVIRNYTGSLNFYELPDYNYNGGIGWMEVKSTGTEASLNLTNQQNTFGPSPSFNTSSFGPFPIEFNDNLSITATFQIDGYIELPPGLGDVNGAAIPLTLKSLNGVNGVIRTTFTFTRTSTSSNIRFTQNPSLNLGIGRSGENYILTDAPNQIYTTQVIDKGYNSGSTGVGNWYFERGANEFNKFTQLTASYDLSNLYSQYISSPIGDVNYFTQNLPTESVNVYGFQDITEVFNPRVGDLIKFYNHESQKYPFSTDFEREIIKIIPPQGPISSGSFGTGSYENRLVIEVSGDDIPNIACINKNNLPGEIGKILNFIFLSKVPDETNIIINYEKRPGQTSAGLLYTEDINLDLKEKAGNIIKGLKSQNLI